MCTVVTLRRPHHDWPLILGANRDEMLSRPWTPPGRHWPDRSNVIAGRDDLANGTWMGLNDEGLVACILNRHGSLGPQDGKRSRGELVLEALDHADANDAAAALLDLSIRAYRPFNLIVADNRDAWWLALRDGATRMHMERIPDGLSMFTAGERNDSNETRIATFLPRFEHVAAPDPANNQWDSWAGLMAATDTTGSEYHAMSFKLANSFGTSSSSLLALPSPDAAFNRQARPVWLFAAGRPDAVPYAAVPVEGIAAMKLNLGCGFNKLDGYVNVDMFPECAPDKLWNLEQTPWPWTGDSAEHILFNHSLEHVGADAKVFFAIMKELYRVAAKDCIIQINVPHPRHDSFLNDPTHVRPVTPDMLGLFSKKLNRHWQKTNAANSQLAFYLSVDFEVTRIERLLDEPYRTQFQNGQLGAEELTRMAKERNNVVSELHITLKAVK